MVKQSIIVFSIISLLYLVGCGKSDSPTNDEKAKTKPTTQSASKPPKEDNLWNYLEAFREKSEMPNIDEIKKRFGEPNKYMEMSENPSYPRSPKREEYYRFTDAEKLLKGWLKVVAWRYHYKGDANHWTDIIVRKEKGTVVGWQWFENVPPGKETGPPQY